MLEDFDDAVLRFIAWKDMNANLEGKCAFGLVYWGSLFFIVGTADASAFSMNFTVFSMSGVPKGTTTLRAGSAELLSKPWD